MYDFIIMNPAHGIYKSDISLGQAAYHIWLDILSRTLELQGQSVFMPKFSLNAYGKKAENICSSSTPQSNGQEKIKQYLDSFRIRDFLHLKSDESLIDDSVQCNDYMTKFIYKLKKENLLSSQGILDLKNIKPEEIDYVIENSNFSSLALKNKVKNLFINNMKGEVDITSDTKYTLCCNGFAIKPIFLIANMWDCIYGEKKIMPFSSNTIGNYVLSRASPHMVLERDFGIDYFYQFPKLNSKLEELFLENLTDDKWIDVFRYACTSAHSLKKESTNLNETHIQKGNRFQKKIMNMANLFERDKIKLGRILKQEPNFNFKSVIYGLEKKLWELSKKISKTRVDGTFEDVKGEILLSYNNILTQASPIIPYTASIIAG